MDRAFEASWVCQTRVASTHRAFVVIELLVDDVVKNDTFHVNWLIFTLI
jgi:hypothetical protein